MKTLLLVIFLLPLMASAELTSIGVGMVNHRGVTSREVQILHFLEVALYQKNPKDSLKALALDSKAFHKATQDVLMETAVSLEAQSFKIVQVTLEELHDSEARALKLLAPVKGWTNLEASKDELTSDLKRLMEAKKFINFRAQNSLVPVTDTEALRYFGENQQRFSNLPFENFKEDIKSYLSRTQVERRLKDWYDVLTNKYQVKNLIAEM